MKLDDFVEAIGPELRALPTPEPSQALRERIIASRQAGARTLLPDVIEPHRPPSRIFVPVAIAVALLILLVPIALRRSSVDVAGADDVTSELLGTVAYGQTLPAARPSLPPMKVVAPERVRPMSLEFARRLRDSGVVTETRVVLDFAAGAVANIPAWTIVSHDLQPGTTQRSAATETTYVARADLTPLRRTIHVTPYHRFQRINIWQEFARDSITGRMNTEGPSIGAGRTFARRLPAAFAPFLTEATTAAFLMGVRFTPDWRGSGSLLGWAVRDEDFFVPVEMRVQAKETITVPAGRFECWRLSIQFAGKQLLYWARTSDGLGVRVLDAYDSPSRTRELVLVKEGRR